MTREGLEPRNEANLIKYFPKHNQLEPISIFFEAVIHSKNDVYSRRDSNPQPTR